MGTFTKKRIQATITLANKTFTPSGSDTLILPKDYANDLGFRISANIDKAGGISLGHAAINIWGMKQTDMNRLTMLAFHPLDFPNNQIALAAGDEQSGLSTVYEGTITAAWADYSASPEVVFKIEAISGYFNQIKTASPTSVKGAQDVSVIIATLAQQMGYTPENNGVHTVLQNPYFTGSPLDQVKAAVAAAGCDYYLDGQILAICPKGQARNTRNIPLISKDTGLIGYPTFDKMGIYFESYFNKDILFGGQVQIKSEIETANGSWRVVSLGHLLESEKPDGQWKSKAWVTDNDLVLPAPT